MSSANLIRELPIASLTQHARTVITERFSPFYVDLLWFCQQIRVKSSKRPRAKGTKRPRVQGSKGPKVQWSKGPRVQGPKRPVVQGSTGPRVQTSATTPASTIQAIPIRGWSERPFPSGGGRRGHPLQGMASRAIWIRTINFNAFTRIRTISLTAFTRSQAATSSAKRWI